MDIRYVEKGDKEFWFRLDKHLAQSEFEKKVRDKMGYVLLADNKPLALLRYNLFWEEDMKKAGYGMVMTSTQVDEDAQHFYRKLGYQDAGGLVINVPKYEQPMEMLMLKEI